MSESGIDYAELIDRVLADDVAWTYFVDLWYHHAPTIFDMRERARGNLRVSDAGSCALQLWAELHDKLDLPENVNSIDSRMHQGIVDGARTSCLIAAGIKRWYWPLTAVIEPEIDALGIRGHADLIVYAEPDPLEVVECKLTFYTKPIVDPKDRHCYWLHQACRYALGVNAPNFVVLVHSPGSWQGPKRAAFRYSTDDYAFTNAIEYGRLAKAQNSDPPDADAPEDERWRCESCRYSQCDRNVNPKRKTVDTVVDELVGI